MGQKDESYLDGLLNNLSNNSENLYNNLLNNDANSFQMSDKEIENIDFSDITEDISFDIDSDIGFDDFDTIDELDDLEDFEDFDETFNRMDQEFNKYNAKEINSTGTLQEEKNERPESKQLDKSAESKESPESKESDAFNELSNFDDYSERNGLNDLNEANGFNELNESIHIANLSNPALENEFEDRTRLQQEGMVTFTEHNEEQMNQDMRDDMQIDNSVEEEPLAFQDSELASSTASNEENSPFEDNLMESLLADSPFANEMDSNPTLEMEEQADDSDPMADVEDLLGLLAQEEANPQALDNLDMFGIDDSSDTTKEPEDVFSIHSLEEELEEPDLQEDSLLNDSMEELLESKKKKKVGLFARLFGNIHDEKARKQNQPKGPVDADGKPIQKPVKSKEEIAAEKELKKKAKEEIKKEKAAKADEIKAQKAAQKQEKAQAKKEKKMQVVVEEDEGRINRVGATIVFLFFGIIAACIILGTDTFSYTQSITKATEYFGKQKYNSAYNEVRGVDVKEKDHEIYDKIMTVMFVNKQLNSYNNYYNMEMYPEALDSLLKGLQRYDEYISIAKELGIESDLDYVRKQILGELNSIFGLTEEASYSIIQSDSQETYSQKVIKAASIN